MDPIFFLKGLIIGFALAVPIGPVEILCIRKTLAEGHSRGLIIGIRTFRAKHKNSVIPFGDKGLLGSYFSAFLLALTNPVTIYSGIWSQLDPECVAKISPG